MRIDVIPSAAPIGATGEAGLLADIPATRRTRAIADIAFVHLRPGGPAVDVDGEPNAIERGQEVVILGDPVEAGGEAWLHLYVLPFTTGSGPDDFFAWLPAEVGDAVLVDLPPAACPAAERDVLALAALDPFSRARCLGAATFAVRGITWRQVLPVWYDVQPEWLGGPNEQVAGFSVHAEAIQGELNAGDAARFLDLQLPPGASPPPLDFTVVVDAHVADPAARECLRSANNDEPDEQAADSRLWCATRLVADRWVPLLGPERRPIDVLSPQLHRWPGPGVNFGCRGVGLPPLTFRIDPAAIDPVILEAEAPRGRFEVIPWFTPEFRAVFSPDLMVVDGAGRVVARDGMPVSPDGPHVGHSLCPTIRGVYFD